LAEERLAQSEENYRQLCHYQEDLIDRERTSISRSIHDDIGQGLTGVYLDLDWIRHKLSPQHGDSNLEELLTTMQARVNQLIVKVQNITADLRPPLLDNLGLKAAVEWQIQEFTRQSMIKTGLVIDDDLPVTDGENSNAIIRILKEALINVLRHSQAEAVDISLCRFGQHLVLEITDDGCGITQEQLSSRTAFGIMGMRERAEACRGELEIWGAPGVGTTVLLEVPVITEGGHV